MNEHTTYKEKEKFALDFTVNKEEKESLTNNLGLN